MLLRINQHIVRDFGKDGLNIGDQIVSPPNGCDSDEDGDFLRCQILRTKDSDDLHRVGNLRNLNVCVT